MRWDHLFDDLSAQLEHELHAEHVDREHEEERLRVSRLLLRERIVAVRADGSARAGVRLRLVSGETVTLRLVTVGRDWCAGELRGSPRTTQLAIPFASIDALLLTPDQVAASLVPVAEKSELGARLGIAFLLRDLARRRTAVTLHTTHGAVTGTIDRVSRDHLDLVEHDVDEPRRQSAVTQIRVIPLERLLTVTL